MGGARNSLFQPRRSRGAVYGSARALSGAGRISGGGVMADVALKPWTPDIDPATIPDEVLKSERGRRNAGRRQSYTGGVVWARHNPRLENSGCRCQKCID